MDDLDVHRQFEILEYGLSDPLILLLRNGVAH